MKIFKIDSDILNYLNCYDYEALKDIFKDHELYLVGGCVRDILLGRSPKDFDFCTDLTPEDMIVLSAAYSSFEVIPTGLKHGTVTLHSKISNNSYEITTFRADGDYSDHRHPNSVEFSKSLEEDLKRRDLTINSFAVDVLHCGEHLDLYMLDESYYYDLRYGIIRAVGDPRKRFEEDALRMLRAIRFSAQLGFTLDADTFNAIKEKASTIQFVSRERIRDELTKIVMSDRPQAFEFLSMTGLDEAIDLPISKMLEEPQHNKYHYTDVFHHTMDVMKSVKKDFVTRWAAFFHDCGKIETVSVDEEGWQHYYGHPDVSAALAAEFMTKYKFDNDSFDAIYKLVKYHDAAIGQDVKMSTMKKFVQKIGKELIPKFIDLTTADRFAHRLDDIKFSVGNIDSGKKKLIEIAMTQAPLSLKDLAVNGYDMMELGLCGKQIGDALNCCLDYILEHPECNTKEVLIKYIEDKHND